MTGTSGGLANFSSTEHWIDLSMVLLCILSAGLAAGLTIGLISIDRNELRLMSINGTEIQKKQAAKILPLIKDHHWLLVTLFLFNATANEALPVFLTGLVPEYAAIAIAAFSVLIFGEIIPSSIFSGPNQLQIAAFLAPVVKILMALFYIVARPIGLLLDAWLGTHDEDGKAPFNAKDLYTLLNLSRAGVINTPSHNVDHVERLSRAPSILSGDLSTPFLDDDAVLIAQGALLSSKKTVRSLVKSSYHSVHGDEKITLDWLEGIGHSGYSRICVTQPSPSTPTPTTSSSTIQQHLGYFVVKEILSDLKRYLSTSCTVKDLPIHPIYFFKETDSILVALNQFQNGHSRIAAVTKDGYPSSPMLGYFSMEDVVEAIIQEEISDEKDSRQYSKSLLQATKSPLLSSADRTATQENRPTVGGISLKEVNWMGKPDSQV